MSARTSAAVSVQAAVEQPPERLVPAIESVLREFSRAGRLNLSIDLAADLQAPLEVSLAVPVTVRAVRGELPSEFAVRIVPAVKRQFYPSFRGMLRITPARQYSSVIDLSGTYSVPLGALGHALDATFLRGSAESSLKRFLAALVDDAAARAAV